MIAQLLLRKGYLTCLQQTLCGAMWRSHHGHALDTANDEAMSSECPCADLRWLVRAFLDRHTLPHTWPFGNVTLHLNCCSSIPHPGEQSTGPAGPAQQTNQLLRQTEPATQNRCSNASTKGARKRMCQRWPSKLVRGAASD